MKKQFEEILKMLGEQIVKMMQFNNKLLEQNLELLKQNRELQKIKND